jgi:hypothetical protein
MTESRKTFAQGALAAVFFLAVLIVIPALFIVGAVKLSALLFPWLELVSIVLFALIVLIVVPLAFVPPCRGFAAHFLLVSSYVFGLTVWVEALLITKTLWGTVGVVVGLLFAGVGIVPVGMLASLFRGAWWQFGDLLLLTAVTYGLRVGALWVASKAEAVKRGERLRDLSAR